MANEGFGSDLWKNLQAVRLTKDGGLEAPVRVSKERGLVVGVDAIAKSEAAGPPPAAAPRRRWWRRWSRQSG